MKHCRVFVWWIFAVLCLLSSGAPAQVITEFAIGITPGAAPFFITTGPDGNLWFTEGAGKIGRITPNGAVTEFSAGITPGNLFGIAAGPDGNLWFTESSDRIGRITTTGVVTEFSTGISAGAKLFGIVAGPDGNLWFTEYGLDRIGRITPTGSVTEFSAGITAGANPVGIAAGPDGNLWFTEHGIARIGRITPSGTVTEFSYPFIGGSPSGITAGADGNLWFTEVAFLPFSPPVRIGQITPSGTVTEFSAGIIGGASGITAGPDGNLWFAETNANRIARISPTGTVTEFTTSDGAGPTGITTGPDGNLWFTESNIYRIGRISTGPGGKEADLSVIKTAPATAASGGTITYTMTVANAGPDAAVNVALSDGPPLSGALSANAKFVSLIAPGWTTTTPLAGTVGRVTATTPILAAGAAATLTLVLQVSASTAEGSGITSTSKVSSDTGDPDWANNVAGATTTVIGVCRKTCSPKRTTTTVVSSINPSQPGQAIVFTASVAGNFLTGTVQFMDGATNLGAPVTLSGGGVAQLMTSTLTQGTHEITAVYSGDAGNLPSQSTALSQVVNDGSGGTSINVALGANGGVASASSTYVATGYAFPVAAVNNGDRAGLNWGNGGGWNDATANAFPDWVQINFNGTQTINQVIVYTLQDNYANPVDPPATLTFTQYGVTDFQVQGWNGAAWVTLGAVSGNNLVKRTVSFAAFSTDRIRINITAALASYSRITEIEAWTASAPGLGTTLASSLNPAKVNQSVTFTATVTGTNPTGSVAFTRNGSSIAGCTAVPLTGSGNSRAASCTTSFAAVGTYSIVASYSGDANNATTSSTALSEVVVKAKK